MKNWAKRFWSKVDVSAGQISVGNGRHPATLAGTVSSGLDGKLHLAHRLVVGLRTGDQGQALHACDWPPCCNPAHLSIGTPQDNMDQKVARGRQVTVPQPGEDNGEAKLTDPEVLEIRARYATGQITQQGLADQYGVHQTIISKIVNRKIWKHI